MNRFARRIFLLLPLFTVLFLALMYLAVDTWLQSAGGRRAVERVLTDQVGLPVELQGDFNIMLLPAAGSAEPGSWSVMPCPARNWRGAEVSA